MSPEEWYRNTSGAQSHLYSQIPQYQVRGRSCLCLRATCRCHSNHELRRDIQLGVISASEASNSLGCGHRHGCVCVCVCALMLLTKLDYRAKNIWVEKSGDREREQRGSNNMKHIHRHTGSSLYYNIFEWWWMKCFLITQNSCCTQHALYHIYVL